MGKSAPNLERPNYVCRSNFWSHVVWKQRGDCTVFLWWCGFKRISTYIMKLSLMESSMSHHDFPCWSSTRIHHISGHRWAPWLSVVSIRPSFRRKWLCDSALCRRTLLEAVITVLLT